MPTFPIRGQKAFSVIKKMNIRTVVFIVLAFLGSVGGCGWSRLMKEHQEARSLSFQSADFTNLADGTYYGRYGGGMYKWRFNECKVTILSGKVTAIELVSSKDPGGENTQYKVLYRNVIKAQSLGVDTISGATLTSKAYLKAVENALVQAQHQ